MNTKTITAKTASLQKRIDEFEGQLRELCYEALCLKEDLAEREPEENTATTANGQLIYSGPALKFLAIEHHLDTFITEYFGGYNSPDEF